MGVIPDICQNVSLEAQVREQLKKHENGEHIDVPELAKSLFRLLYDQIPALTSTKHKDKQHEHLENYLISLGLPKSNDLQWIAGPLLWFAREHSLMPLAQSNGNPDESWTINKRRYSRIRPVAHVGFKYYGDWMTSTLQSLLFQQQ